MIRIKKKNAKTSSIRSANIKREREIFKEYQKLYEKKGKGNVQPKDIEELMNGLDFDPKEVSNLKARCATYEEHQLISVEYRKLVDKMGKENITDQEIVNMMEKLGLSEIPIINFKGELVYDFEKKK